LTGLSGGIPLMSLDFAQQHVSGHPYELTLTQFFDFLGLGGSFRRAQIQDFSSMIKERLLEILPQYRKVRIRTESEIWWEYKTKSKTVFQIQIINKKMKFFVIIPANRDREGKKHYIRLRIGEPYNGAVFQR
jgi:hypothetical protein